MEILWTIKELEDQVYGAGLTEEDIQKVRDQLSDFGEVKISEENIGAGADVMVILVTILTISNVFLIGDKIDKGIEGWIKLANRLKGLIKKDELISLDIEAASLIAIEFISQYESISSLKKTSEQEIALVDFSQVFNDGRSKKDLISKPYSYYTFSFNVNIEKHYLIGVKSHGEANLIKCFDAFSGYGIKEIKTTPQQDV